MNKKTYTYEFLLPLSNHKKYPIKITSDKHIKSSPIEGYAIQEDYMHGEAKQLVYKPFTKKHMMMLLILVLLSLCVGGCAGWFVKSYFSKSKIEKLEKEIFSLKANVSSKEKELASKDKELVKFKENVDWALVVYSPFSSWV